MFYCQGTSVFVDEDNLTGLAAELRKRNYEVTTVSENIGSDRLEQILRTNYVILHEDSEFWIGDFETYKNGATLVRDDLESSRIAKIFHTNYTLAKDLHGTFRFNLEIGNDTQTEDVKWDHHPVQLEKMDYQRQLGLIVQRYGNIGRLLYEEAFGPYLDSKQEFKDFDQLVRDVGNYATLQTDILLDARYPISKKINLKNGYFPQKV
ncbi:MAG: hypothetical protein ABEK50_00320, partial [bacterium]